MKQQLTINEKHIICSNKLFEIVTSTKEHRQNNPTLYLYNLHSGTPTFPTTIPIHTFDDFTDLYSRPQRLEADGCTFWTPDAFLFFSGLRML